MTLGVMEWFGTYLQRLLPVVLGALSIVGGGARCGRYFSWTREARVVGHPLAFSPRGPRVSVPMSVLAVDPMVVGRGLPMRLLGRMGRLPPMVLRTKPRHLAMLAADRRALLLLNRLPWPVSHLH